MPDGARSVLFEEDGRRQYEDRTLRLVVHTRYSSVKPFCQESREYTHHGSSSYNAYVPCQFSQIDRFANIDHGTARLSDPWTELRMLLRDVGIYSIVYEIHEDHSGFILIDYDMTAVISKAKSSYVASSHHRTGTLPLGFSL